MDRVTKSLFWLASIAFNLEMVFPNVKELLNFHCPPCLVSSMRLVINLLGLEYICTCCVQLKWHNCFLYLTRMSCVLSGCQRLGWRKWGKNRLKNTHKKKQKCLLPVFFLSIMFGAFFECVLCRQGTRLLPDVGLHHKPKTWHPVIRLYCTGSLYGCRDPVEYTVC